jgi:hypothetical protein
MRLRIRRVWTMMTLRALQVLTKEVTDGMEGNAALFPNPDPPLVDLTAAAAELQKVQDGTKTTPGTSKLQREKRRALEALLSHEADYVLRVSEKLPPDKAAAAIEASGFSMLANARRGKPDIAATRGPVSGCVEVDALRSAVAEKRSWRVIFYWEYSLNGKDWVDAGHTVDTRMTIRGLPVGATVSFRYRAFVKKAFTDYSQVVTLVVV